MLSEPLVGAMRTDGSLPAVVSLLALEKIFLRNSPVLTPLPVTCKHLFHCQPECHRPPTLFC